MSVDRIPVTRLPKGKNFYLPVAFPGYFLSGSPVMMPLPVSGFCQQTHARAALGIIHYIYSFT
jgi:hypothetical protein